ncbi:MAG TPA: rod shape-determining protein MreC, partial [Caulobacteraceae bacterium]|nr:rod shape-determining protein MreC [Caulobacteraceae bacterium]
DGGVFPRGLPVGTVVKGFDGGWRVALDSDAAPIDYVQILLFTDFSQLANEQALAPKELPTAMTEEPSQSIAPPIPTTAAKPAAGVAARPAAAGAAAAAKPAEKLTAAEVAAREKARADAKRAAEKAAAPPPKKKHFGFL